MEEGLGSRRGKILVGDIFFLLIVRDRYDEEFRNIYNLFKWELFIFFMLYFFLVLAIYINL